MRKYKKKSPFKCLNFNYRKRHGVMISTTAHFHSTDSKLRSSVSSDSGLKDLQW